jgi:hypothetical protein
MLVYVAVIRDVTLSVDEVITVQTKRENLEKYIKEYYGISDDKKYTNPAEFLGYTKIEYSEFEDDLEGYYTFKEDGETTNVYLFTKALDEFC